MTTAIGLLSLFEAASLMFNSRFLVGQFIQLAQGELRDQHSCL